MVSLLVIMQRCKVFAYSQSLKKKEMKKKQDKNHDTILS